MILSPQNSKTYYLNKKGILVLNQIFSPARKSGRAQQNTSGRYSPDPLQCVPCIPGRGNSPYRHSWKWNQFGAAQQKGVTITSQTQAGWHPGIVLRQQRRFTSPEVA